MIGEFVKNESLIGGTENPYPQNTAAWHIFDKMVLARDTLMVMDKDRLSYLAQAAALGKRTHDLSVEIAGYQAALNLLENNSGTINV